MTRIADNDVACLQVGQLGCLNQSLTELVDAYLLLCGDIYLRPTVRKRDSIRLRTAEITLVVCDDYMLMIEVRGYLLQKVLKVSRRTGKIIH